MDHNEANRLEEIDRDECLQLLRDQSYVGRIGFIVDGRPMVLPVNYVVDAGTVVFSSLPGTKLSVVRDGAPVAFEVDDSHALYHSGWSVVVQGTAREITDPDEVERLRRGRLRAWAQGAREHWVRIAVEEISGRRIPGT